ncbi:MAG: dinitrogenase iron-molybdenum cofactor biosynthesis protein [Desulfovibrionaceae bacterium]|nr:dinitrogenase iron-molybdenum cofactor biosynthesis protein [Desulfovibrionaceae bacterium]
MIPLSGEEIAPRFDLATEVRVVQLDISGKAPLVLDDKVVVLPQASAEVLCRLVLSEAVNSVICAGIDEEYYQFLTWKKVRVLDDVVGPADSALAALLAGTLSAGDNLYPQPG